jgi:hypothetical protein
MAKALPKLIDSRAAAAEFGVHLATFNRWVQKGTVTAAWDPGTLRGQRLFDRAYIRRLAREHKAKADEQPPAAPTSAVRRRGAGGSADDGVRGDA